MEANIVEQALSDGSKVYNIKFRADGRDVKIGCVSLMDAIDLAQALRNGAAWVEIFDGGSKCKWERDS